MEMASLTGFFRVIFIIILVWYAFKFLARIFGPIIIRKAASKMQEKMQQKMNDQMKGQFGNKNTFDNQNNTQTSKPEFPKEKKKVGEYVDFEELD